MYQPIQYSFFTAEERSLRFNVHLHHATRVHYDLRLECGQVLQSWVLPDGPSLNPSHQRPMVRVRDHQLTCLGKEGRIPAGNYGAGPLLLWDEGTYVAISDDEEVSQEHAIEKGLQEGELRLRFDGKKLCGDWLLLRKKENWYFEKIPDDYASKENILAQDQSVRTGRRIGDL